MLRAVDSSALSNPDLQEMCMSSLRRTWATGLAAGLSAVVAAAGMSAPLTAHAADAPIVTPAVSPSLTTTASNGSGGTVTIDSDHVVKGGSLRVTGTGFATDPGSGSTGSAVLALKVNDIDFPWTLSGPSALTIADLSSDPGEGFAPVRIEDDGTFEVTLTVPTDWASDGSTVLRFLGGSMTTGTKRLAPQSFAAKVAVLRPTQGFASVASIAHAQDSANTAKVQVRLRNFRSGADGLGASQKVGVKLNGAGDIIQCLGTDAQGDTDVTVNLPAKSVVDLPAGENKIFFLAGTACVSGVPATEGPAKSVQTPFQITKSTVTSTAHHPGGSVEATLENFVSTTPGAGQKVALKITGTDYQQPTTVCVVTDGFGNGIGNAPIPADLAPGEYTLNALAGTNCGEGGNGAPGRSLQAKFTVNEKPAFAVSAAARVTGTATVGQKLTAAAPTFSSTAARLDHQWLRNGATISGATAGTYTLSAADLGKRLAVRVTGTDSDGRTAVSTSATTSSVKAAKFSVKKKVTIKGTAKVGKKLKATTASFSTSSVKTKYQWLRNGKAIKKATKSTYKLTKSDRKKKVSLKVTFSKSGHSTVTQKTKSLKVR